MSVLEDQSKPADDTRLCFHYLKTPDFRPIYVDGVYGNVHPKRRVTMAVYSERLPLPQKTVHGFTKNGKLTDEIPEERVSKEGIVRDVSAVLHLDVDTARSVAAWLNERCDEIERLFPKIPGTEDK